MSADMFLEGAADLRPHLDVVPGDPGDLPLGIGEMTAVTELLVAAFWTGPDRLRTLEAVSMAHVYAELEQERRR